MGPAAFLDALRDVPALERDGWVDRVLGLDELPCDGPELPRGCVPYLPCSVNTLLRMIEIAGVRESDVFVDIGAGVGRATALLHFATGAAAIGVEVQSALARCSRELAARFDATRITTLEGDAAELVRQLTDATVFFLYCPFGANRVGQVLDDIEAIAKTHAVRVCCVNLPFPSRRWLVPVSICDDLAVYESRA